MVELNKMKMVKVEARTLRVNVWPKDSGSYAILDADGEKIVDKDEVYVPEFVPGSYGDSIEIDIDINTGQITNWVRPSVADLETFINGGEDG